MTLPIGRLLPRRIATQTAAVVIVSMALIQLALIAHLWWLESQAEGRRREFVPGWNLIRVVTEAPPGAERQRLVADVLRAYPSLEIELSRTPPTRRGEELNGFASSLPPFVQPGPGYRVVELAPVRRDETAGGSVARDRMVPWPRGSGAARRFAVGLADGDWITFTDRPPPPPPFLFGAWGASIVFALLSSALLGIWAVRGLVGPLRALAAAARDFDIEGDIEPLPLRGPEEVRIAAISFEAMRRRIRALVEDRTRMLAAMGHDLRTPLTRMRLRSEFVADDALRTEFQRDLAGMNTMIEGALTYLSEGRHREATGLVDLSSTLQTIADGWTDLGRDVDYVGPDHLVARVRPAALDRALANLVDNALKFGGRCTLRLKRAGDDVVIEVEDDGPGIAEADRDAMLRPFVRGDAARNMDDSRGFGLGLSIVEAVVEAHGGRLELASAEPHGLVVRILLPRAVEDAPRTARRGA